MSQQTRVFKVVSRRCGDCKGSQTPDCVGCCSCKDMVKFSGSGARKKSCKMGNCCNATEGIHRAPGSDVEKCGKTGTKLSQNASFLMKKTDVLNVKFKHSKIKRNMRHNINQVQFRSAKVDKELSSDDTAGHGKNDGGDLKKCSQNIRSPLLQKTLDNAGSYSNGGIITIESSHVPRPGFNYPITNLYQTANVTPKKLSNSEDSLNTSSTLSMTKNTGRSFFKELLIPFSAEIYICFFCEKEFFSEESMRSHQDECLSQSPKLPNDLSESSSLNKKILHTAVTPKNSNEDAKWCYVSLEKFSRCLDLIPKQAAAKLREQRSNLEIKCDLSEKIEPMSPVTPLTPKTPRSLISQLSREDHKHISRNTLSFSNSTDKVMSLESDSDSECETEKGKPGNELNFLNISVSSLLGQRIKKYVHVNSPMAVVTDSQSFCKTPVKNKFLEKLRKKLLSYPVLYRPRRIANLHKQNHIYRFSKQQREEFICRTETGLSLNSLETYRKMRKLKVLVKRMSRRELLKWIPKYVLERQLKGVYKELPQQCIDSEFPSGPTLLAHNIDRLLGLKKRTTQESARAFQDLRLSLSLANFASVDMVIEISKQKLTLYKCLLHEMSVLKPVVVLEDLAKKVTKFQAEVSKNDNLEVISRANINSNKNSGFMKILDHPTEKGCLGKEENQKFKVQAKENIADNYSVLKAILMSRTSLQSYWSNNDLSSVVVNKEMDQQTSPLCDNTVSVMSMCSDTKSLHSNYCMDYTDQKCQCVSKMVSPVYKTPTDNIDLSENKETLNDPPDEDIDVDINVTLNW